MAKTTENHSITPETRPVVEALDRFAARSDVLSYLQRAVDDAYENLQQDPDLAESFVTIDFAQLAGPVPSAIGSARVMVTRGPGGASVERHGNSTQYLFALGGALETHVNAGDGWRIDRYGEGDAAVLENRWHVVPPGVWHKSVAPSAQFWSVAAFHSAREVSDEYQ